MWTRRCKNFILITVVVSNDMKKKRGFLPWHVAAKYKLMIGHSPTIGTMDGHLFHVRFLLNLNEGMFTNGWTDFIEACNLSECNKIILKYHGESFFNFDEGDQESLQRTLNRNKKIKVEEDDDQPEVHNVFGQIKLSPYSTSNSHQSLPISFVQSCLNLKWNEVLVEVEGDRKWRLGLYTLESRPREARLTLGWKNICQHLHLKPGDIIIFKEQDRSTNYLLAHIE